MAERCGGTVEVIRGDPRILGEHQIRQKVIEIPEKEIHKIVKPGRQFIHHTIRQVPGTLQKDVIDYESGQHKQLELFNTRYVEKVIVKEVEQLIEVPREVEEVVYVDEPEYEIVEIPEYFPVVVSQRVQPRVDENKVKVVEDVCWIPHVMYDATKDPKRMSRLKESSSSEQRAGRASIGGKVEVTGLKETPPRFKQTVTQVACDVTPQNYSWTGR